jgi:riboflavin-specific deaminase-like protein
MLELFPEHRSLSAEEAYGELGLVERAPPDRPYVAANMVATVDGRATLGGRTAAISSTSDRELFHRLREQVDAVMVGVGTIALERYGPLVRDAERRRRRVERGLEPQPLAVTATRSLELPVQTPLFADPDSRIVVLTNSQREAPAAGAQMTVERIPGDELDLALGLRLLRERHGVRALLLEGGPTLLGAMVAARLVDELFLSLAPLLAGGAGEPAIVEGLSLQPAAGLELRSALHDDGYLFLRYALRPAPAAGTD